LLGFPKDAIFDYIAALPLIHVAGAKPSAGVLVGAWGRLGARADESRWRQQPYGGRQSGTMVQITL